MVAFRFGGEESLVGFFCGALFEEGGLDAGFLVVGEGEDFAGFERSIVNAKVAKFSAEVVTGVAAEAERGVFFCGAGVAVGVVENFESGFISVDEEVLIGGSKLAVEGEGEVGPFVEWEFFGGLDLGDPGDPTGDDGVAEVSLAELEIEAR